MSVQAYPLHWPAGFPRSKTREASRFRTDFDAALKNVRGSLRSFAADSGRKLEDPIMSSNHNVLMDDTPDDPGVAVWFRWDNTQLCIAVDRYLKIADNLQAVHHILEARRTELRHGSLQLVRASFAGFKALPAPKGEHWSDVLQVTRDATVEQIEQGYRKLAKYRHPDQPGGSDSAMARLNTARETAIREIGG
ncbi:J domain-containing protein [Bradyrhizobium diazoefficiens]|uniref:J domain-containing protein n=1 Tax=Bradyrhizobium diazoefficiens TaxID=1355477 RepID=UPI00272B1E18|nr:J domain-containing protein [Bradyrhizobium diazoefficiens]WLA75074.1 J domain-containing protein [Bradyrhizobium diazoefficiens]